MGKEIIGDNSSKQTSKDEKQVVVVAVGDLYYSLPAHI